jgi:hypothetical protein
MKYLLLFDYGQKRIMCSFWSRKKLIEKINYATEMADDVIESLTEESRNKYALVFKDNTAAKLRIVRSEDLHPLGYYYMDFYYFMTKLRNQMLAKRTAERNALQAKRRNQKRRLRQTLTMFAIGLVSIATGFVLVALF